MSTIIRTMSRRVLQAIFLAAASSAAALPSVGAEAVHGADAQFAFIDQYCSDCHNDIEFKGKVAFDAMTPEGIPADAKVWEAAVRKLRSALQA